LFLFSKLSPMSLNLFRSRIYHENMRLVYDSILHHPILSTLHHSFLPNVCFLDMQNIFRHCPLQEFQKIHVAHKHNSEALFHTRQKFLLHEGIHSTVIEDAVLRYYQDKFPTSNPNPTSLKQLKKNNTLWILVSQKNMRDEKDSILDVINVDHITGGKKKMLILLVGCFFFHDKQFQNCSSFPSLKNEMDDYTMLTLATRFLLPDFPASLSPKQLKKKQKQHLFLFSNDNFTKKESMISLQHHLHHKVHFLHFPNMI